MQKVQEVSQSEFYRSISPEKGAESQDSQSNVFYSALGEHGSMPNPSTDGQKTEKSPESSKKLDQPESVVVKDVYSEYQSLFQKMNDLRVEDQNAKDLELP